MVCGPGSGVQGPHARARATLAARGRASTPTAPADQRARASAPTAPAGQPPRPRPAGLPQPSQPPATAAAQPVPAGALRPPVAAPRAPAQTRSKQALPARAQAHRPSAVATRAGPTGAERHRARDPRPTASGLAPQWRWQRSSAMGAPPPCAEPPSPGGAPGRRPVSGSTGPAAYRARCLAGAQTAARDAGAATGSGPARAQRPPSASGPPAAARPREHLRRRLGRGRSGAGAVLAWRLRRRSRSLAGGVCDERQAGRRARRARRAAAVATFRPRIAPAEEQRAAPRAEPGSRRAPAPACRAHGAAPPRRRCGAVRAAGSRLRPIAAAGVRSRGRLADAPPPGPRGSARRGSLATDGRAAGTARPARGARPRGARRSGVGALGVDGSDARRSTPSGSASRRRPRTGPSARCGLPNIHSYAASLIPYSSFRAGFGAGLAAPARLPTTCAGADRRPGRPPPTPRRRRASRVAARAASASAPRSPTPRAAPAAPARRRGGPPSAAASPPARAPCPGARLTLCPRVTRLRRPSSRSRRPARGTAAGRRARGRGSCRAANGSDTRVGRLPEQLLGRRPGHSPNRPSSISVRSTSKRCAQAGQLTDPDRLAVAVEPLVEPLEVVEVGGVQALDQVRRDVGDVPSLVTVRASSRTVRYACSAEPRRRAGARSRRAPSQDASCRD